MTEASARELLARAAAERIRLQNRTCAGDVLAALDAEAERWERGECDGAVILPLCDAAIAALEAEGYPWLVGRARALRVRFAALLERQARIGELEAER